MKWFLVCDWPELNNILMQLAAIVYKFGFVSFRIVIVLCCV